jgi:hypothetical protein
MDTPTWQRTNTEGLYLNTHSGIHYSRYRLKGKRTFRSLKTNSLTRAKILHATKRVDLEKDRARDVGLTGRDSTDYRTLGALVKEAERRFAATKVASKTVEARAAGIARLRKHWIDGTFETFPARNVTPDTIVRLRQHLLTEAEWRGHRHINSHLGFHPRVVNHALWVLRVLLDIAIEKGVLVEQPFTQTGTLRKTLRAVVPADKKAEIPDRSVMVRVFAEMRRVPEEARDFYTTREQLHQLQINAEEMADHAELLAYSGMRRDEAKKSTLADDKNGEFKIWGTKSVTSDRTIPVNPALRGVLDRIRSRRLGDKAKLVIFKQPRMAMQRACKRLGLPPLHNHALRHFFASVCIASGVEIQTVSRWLGHADGGALAMKTYGHLLKDSNQAAAAKVDFSDQSVPKVKRPRTAVR